MSEPLLNSAIPSPCYVLESAKLENNLKLMAEVQQQANIKIILALKGFSMWSAFPQVGKYLQGCTASSVWEAQLAQQEMGKEVHAYAPAYKQADMDKLVKLAKHISFNSINQWQQYQQQTLNAGVSAGLRINPEHRETSTELYDPSAPGSRLGVLAQDLSTQALQGIEGFHVHNLCECDSFATERTIAAVERKFGKWLGQLKWLNLGGGHLMTRQGYNVKHLIHCLTGLGKRYPNLEIILEPGSAVAWDTGPLICEVVDIVKNRDSIAILDISATAHMPDVLEMPYRPTVSGSGEEGEKAYNYTLAGNSCLAGDVIGRYSFDQPLQPGDRLIFNDMMHYTMVKTSFFNGVEHPAIGILNKDGSFNLVRQFNYQDFKQRLS